MLDQLASIPDGLPVRSTLAYSVRLAWRVLPILGEAAAGSHAYACLAMAEAVAGGEAVHPLQARVTLQRMEEAGRTVSERSPRQKCAFDTACYATLGGLHIHQAVEELGIDVMAAAKAQDDNLRIARKALHASMNEGMRALGLWEAPWSVQEKDKRLADKALSVDLGRLVHYRAIDVVGEPLWPAEKGRLGELWPDGDVPSWQDDKGSDAIARTPAAIVPGTELAALDGVVAVPTVAFWTLYEDGQPLEDVRRQIVVVSERHRRNSSPRPVCVVHAPDIASDSTDRLMEVGATVLRDVPAEHWRECESSGFEAWLALTLRIREAAAKQGTASWKREEARLNWRDPGFLVPGSARRTGHRCVDVPVGTREVTSFEGGHTDADNPYAAFVARSMQSMRDRVGAERGGSRER